MICPPTCTAARWAVDRLDFTDLIAGRRGVKVRVLCAVGHSFWDVEDLGPLDEREAVDLRTREYHHQRKEPARPCGHCGVAILRPSSGQKYHVECKDAGIRAARAKREPPAWPDGRARALMAKYNGGASLAECAGEFGIKNARTTTVIIGMLQKRGYAFVRRQHGGAR